MLFFLMALLFIGGMLIGACLCGMAYAEIRRGEAYVRSWRKSIEEIIAERERPVGEPPDIRPKI